MPGGYMGKILFVDLTAGALEERELPEKIYRDYIGGYGLGARIVYERLKPRTDPLGARSILGFVPGLLTGTPVPASGRYMVVGKSPLTGTWGEANGGGAFGPALKEAGYDGIFFTGISPAPVCLLVRDGKAELRDASRLWGKDTYETDDLLHDEIGDPEIKVACIGPAGEMRSLLAGIVNEKGRTAARSGLGAVMGAKKLKAVAVRGGFRKVPVADRQGLAKARRMFQDIMKASEFQKALKAGGTSGGTSHLVSIGDSPVKNWRVTGLDALPTVSNLDSANMEKYKIRNYACYACPVRCGAILEQKDGPFAIPEEMHRPEYESVAALGGMQMNDNLEAVIKANDICNRSGIDTISTGGTIAFAMECYEKGLISRADTDGIELTWGNAAAVVAMTEKIARREGFGALLADGAGKAAERIGKGSEEFAIAVLGQSLAYHDPRMSPALGTAMIADANPAHHMDCQITIQLEAGASIGADPALQTQPLQPLGDFDKKGPMYAIGSKFHALFNAAGMCALYTVGSSVPLAELIAGVTGWDFGWEEGLRTGHRILTLRQAFNAREGLTPDRFRLPRRIQEELLKVGPCAGVRIDFETLRNSYFEAMGWDIRSGRPYPDTLRSLGLEELVGDLS